MCEALESLELREICHSLKTCIPTVYVHHSGTYAVLVTDIYHMYMFTHVQYAYKFEARSIIELRVKFTVKISLNKHQEY